MNILPNANEKPVSPDSFNICSPQTRRNLCSLPIKPFGIKQGERLGFRWYFFLLHSNVVCFASETEKAFGIWLIRRDFALHPSRVPSCTKIYSAVSSPRLTCTQLQCASPKPSNHSDSHAVSDPSRIGALEATLVGALPHPARSLPPGSSPSNAHLPEMTLSPIYSLSILWPQSSSV